MSGSVCKVILIGNVGRDPETRSFSNGGKVVQFSLATSETWIDRASGERKERTEWHAVVVKNEKIGDFVERYVRKGSKLYVEGTIQSRKYQDKDGVERSITEIVVGPFRGEVTSVGDRKSDGEERKEPVQREAAPRVRSRELDEVLSGDDYPF